MVRLGGGISIILAVRRKNSLSFVFFVDLGRSGISKAFIATLLERAMAVHQQQSDSAWAKGLEALCDEPLNQQYGQFPQVGKRRHGKGLVSFSRLLVRREIQGSLYCLSFSMLFSWLSTIICHRQSTSQEKSAPGSPERRFKRTRLGQPEWSQETTCSDASSRRNCR